MSGSISSSPKLPSAVKYLRDVFSSHGLSAEIIENSASTASVHDQQTGQKCGTVTELRMQSLEMENSDSEKRGGIARQREIKTVLWRLNTTSKASAEHKRRYESAIFSVSCRGNRILNRNSVKASLARELGMSRSHIDIDEIPEAKLTEIGLASGLINPFRIDVDEILINILDPDLFLEYYLGEALTTNSNHHEYSIHLSLKNQASRILSAFRRVRKAHTSLCEGGESSSLKLLDRLAATDIYLIGYDQLSLVHFQNLFRREWNVRLSTLTDTFQYFKLERLDKKVSVEEIIPVPKADLFSFPSSVTTYQFSSSAIAMYDAGHKRIIDNIEKTLNFIPRDTESVLFVPCNILPEYVEPELVRQGRSNYIGMSSALETELNELLRIKLSEINRTGENRKVNVALLAGRRVQKDKSSIYNRLLRSQEYQSFIKKVSFNQEELLKIDNVMRRVQSENYSGAFELLNSVVERKGEIDILIIGSTSISLLRNEIDQFDNLICRKSRDCMMLDVLEKYANLCVDKLFNQAKQF